MTGINAKRGHAQPDQRDVGQGPTPATLAINQIEDDHKRRSEQQDDFR